MWKSAGDGYLLLHGAGGGLRLLKTFENLCVEVHSGAFLAHTTDFVRSNYIKNSIHVV